MTTLRQINRVLGKYFVTKYGTSRESSSSASRSPSASVRPSGALGMPCSRNSPSGVHCVLSDLLRMVGRQTFQMAPATTSSLMAMANSHPYLLGDTGPPIRLTERARQRHVNRGRNHRASGCGTLSGRLLGVDHCGASGEESDSSDQCEEDGSGRTRRDRWQS